VIPREALTNEKDDSVRALLNEAWRVFGKTNWRISEAGKKMLFRD